MLCDFDTIRKYSCIIKYNILIVSILFSSSQSVTSTICFWNTGCPYKYFSSKTPYEFVRGDIRDSVIKINGCEPISIWALHRHGQRNPEFYFGNNLRTTLSLRDEIDSSYKHGKSSLCAQDIENLRNWPLDPKIFNFFDLTEEGYDEMYGIGKRLKQTFSNILTNLDDGDYTIKPAHGTRMVISAKAFVKGLDSGKLFIQNDTLQADVMAPYAVCAKFFKDIKDNPKTYNEVTKYVQTAEYLAAKDRIQRRLGIDYILTDKNITGLYDLCRYTSGKDGKFSPWCALFTKKDLLVLEYIGDMKIYYRNGYGSPLSEKFGQIPMADLLKKFRLAKDGKGEKFTAYFTHATMVNMIYVALGLFKDTQPLTAAHRDPERKWRSSKVSSFSVNIVAVLNKCTKEGVIDHNVVFYLNEEPLLTICKQGICSWEEFEEKFKPFLNTKIDFCEFENMYNEVGEGLNFDFK